MRPSDIVNAIALKLWLRVCSKSSTSTPIAKSAFGELGSSEFRGPRSTPRRTETTCGSGCPTRARRSRSPSTSSTHGATRRTRATCVRSSPATRPPPSSTSRFHPASRPSRSLRSRTRASSSTVVAMEKPFGTDTRSARALNRLICERLQPSQVLRVDHDPRPAFSRSETEGQARTRPLFRTRTESRRRNARRQIARSAIWGFLSACSSSSWMSSRAASRSCNLVARASRSLSRSASVVVACVVHEQTVLITSPSEHRRVAVHPRTFPGRPMGRTRGKCRARGSASRSALVSSCALRPSGSRCGSRVERRRVAGRRLRHSANRPRRRATRRRWVSRIRRGAFGVRRRPHDARGENASSAS